MSQAMFLNRNAVVTLHLRALRGFVWASALALATLSIASAATRTITGQIVYGPVIDDLGEISDPAHFIPVGSPIAHVTVQLNDGAEIKRGDDITDDSGRFSIDITGTPNLTLVTKSRNDHVEVKQDNGVLNLPIDDVIKTKRNIVVDYSTCTAIDLRRWDDHCDRRCRGYVYNRAPRADHELRFPRVLCDVGCPRVLHQDRESLRGRLSG